jgi:hypothetical protein
MAKTYSQEITDAQVMAAGIKVNQTVLAKRGINAKFTEGLEGNISTCVVLNNEQEQLKARLKEKTEELNKQMAELKKKTQEARKIVKLDIPQTAWKEFGIADKR